MRHETQHLGVTSTPHKDDICVSIIHKCEHCGSGYDWRKSTATLRMTYCGWLCERAVYGFVIRDIEHWELEKPIHKDVPPIPEPAEEPIFV